MHLSCLQLKGMWPKLFRMDISFPMHISKNIPEREEVIWQHIFLKLKMKNNKLKTKQRLRLHFTCTKILFILKMCN